MSDETVRAGDVIEHVNEDTRAKYGRMTVKDVRGGARAVVNENADTWFVASGGFRIVSRASDKPAHRTGCEAWCGCMWGFIPLKAAGIMFTNEDVRPGEGGKFCWCSAACRDARLPANPTAPVEAAKVEPPKPAAPGATCCPDAYHGKSTHQSWCKCSSPPKPAAEAPKAPVCVACDESGPTVIKRPTRIGIDYECERCMLLTERCYDISADNAGPGLAKSAIPERIDRRLSYDAVSCWDGEGS